MKEGIEDIVIEVTQKGDIRIAGWEKLGISAEEFIKQLRDIYYTNYSKE